MDGAERGAAVLPRAPAAVHGTRADRGVAAVAAGRPHRRDRRAALVRHLRRPAGPQQPQRRRVLLGPHQGGRRLHQGRSDLF